ncbi:hypothetical protein ACIQYZ_13515 [Rhodococcus erythropolis]
MSDNEHVEYVDEDGNPLTPEEVAALGDDVEVEEVAVAPAPAAKQPAAAPSAPVGKGVKAALAGAAVVVLALGGGLAYTMSQVGNENTASDVKDAVASKSSEIRESIAPSSSAVPVEEAEVHGTPVTGLGCQEGAFLAAQWAEGDPAPTHQLGVEEVISMPVGFTERMRKGEEKAGQRPKTAAVQMSSERLGIYVAGTENAQSNGDPVWWRVNVAISGGFSVIGEGYGDGSDRDARMASCPTIDAGTYRVVGDGGSTDAPTAVTLVKPEWSKGALGGWALIGDKLARVQVEQTPKGGDAASSSPAPSE